MSETPQPTVKYGQWQARLGGEVVSLPVMHRSDTNWIYSKVHEDRAVFEVQAPNWFLWLKTGDGWCRLGGTDFRNATKWLNGEPVSNLEFLSVVWQDAAPPAEKVVKKRAKR